jgi:hypothetical protein
MMSSDSSHLENNRILVVDDDKDFTLLIKTKLVCSLGYEVFTFVYDLGKYFEMAGYTFNAKFVCQFYK